MRATSERLGSEALVDFVRRAETERAVTIDRLRAPWRNLRFLRSALSPIVAEYTSTVQLRTAHHADFGVGDAPAEDGKDRHFESMQFEARTKAFDRLFPVRTKEKKRWPEKADIKRVRAELVTLASSTGTTSNECETPG